MLKTLERVLDRRLRAKVELEVGEEQQGFRKGRSTSDGLFVVRQWIEKTVERGGDMVIDFVGLQKAFNSVLKNLVTATLKWLNVKENDVS